ncbi:hypothetical protein AAG906_018281 [Vitis piasezkii]
MESATSLSSSVFSTCWLFSTMSSRRRNPTSKVVAVRGGASGRDYEGNLVDENMIVLRMRIQQMKRLETGDSPPSNWMGWEKRYYVHYNEDVCKAVGLLQCYLMNIRPSLALGTLLLIILSVAISSVGVMFHALEMARGILPGFHLN